QYCENFATVFTYNSKDKQGNLTFGGYANHIVADEAFVLKVPGNLDLAAAAPLLCAGITTYSPLKHFGAGPGKKVGIIGLGGLGHMGLKFSHAFGAKTVQFTTSPSKIEDAKKLGADEVILTKEADWTKNHIHSFDFILDCVAAPHDVNPYLSLLKRDGVYCTVGVPETPLSIQAFSVLGRKHVTGSMIGGIKETQEMLDFCGQHNIVSDIEMTSFTKLSEAWTRVVKADVKYRFVLDCKAL
ncbi:MAG: zinc-binding dehydrogenase, partial [Acidobacteria bacterium]|nr:zinc-binding dehydrogenase [Acidobacteriota bacterium]